MKRWLTFTLFLAGALSLQAGPGFEKEPPTLRAAVAERDYPPFYYTDPETGKLTGLSTDICDAVAGKLGYRIVNERYPFTRVLNNLDRGESDLACTLFNTRHRAPGNIYVSVPHAVEEIYAIALTDTLSQLPETSQNKALSGDTLQMTFGGVRGYYYGTQYIPHLTLYNSDKNLPEALASGRIKIALSNLPTFRWYAAEDDSIKDNWGTLGPPWYSGAIYMAFSREHPQAEKLAAEFTEALIEFKQTEEYRKLLRQYGMNAPDF